MEIKICIEDKSQWDEYVKNSPKGTLFHLSGWLDAVERVFGYKQFDFVAKQDARIVGILPLFLCKNIFFKKTLISIPFASYGGILADTSEIYDSLLNKAIDLAKEKQVEYLELRNQEQTPMLEATQTLYVTFIRELPKNIQDCLSMLPRKARAEARHAIDNGLTTQTGPHLLDECYKLYAINSKRLGSPFLPLVFFKTLANNFKDTSTVLSVKIKDQTAASVFIFFYKDTMMPIYSGNLFKFTKYGTNNLMYLKTMELGTSMGFKYFDFGRSRKDSGPYNFKINQGFAPKQLFYQFYFNETKKMPNINPSNPKLGIFKTVWRNAPSILTNKLGPFLIKYVP